VETIANEQQRQLIEERTGSNLGKIIVLAICVVLFGPIRQPFLRR
jgi:hypothetical protein